MNINNQNRINKLNFNGITPKKIETKCIDEFIKEMVDKLLQRAKREVPEYGPFKTVYEAFENIDKDLFASDFMLKIVPNKIKGHEKERYLEVVAYKLPLRDIVEIPIEQGDKNKILEKLNNKNIYQEIKEKFITASENLEEALNEVRR